MKQFLIDNQPFILLLLALAVIVLLILVALTLSKSSKLNKSMLVNKFKVTDMNETNTSDNAPLYTIVVSNNSMNTVSIGSIGFVHDGDYFNYRNECKAQLSDNNRELVILPRGSIKLRLYKEQLESAVFKQAKTKRLKTVYVYLIGLGGETFKAKAKIITRKMKASYKEYYAFHEPSVIAKFIGVCRRKTELGAKLKFFENIKYKCWSKRVKIEIPSVKTPMEEFEDCPKETPKEVLLPVENSIKDCNIDNPPVVDPSKSNDEFGVPQSKIEESADGAAFSETENNETGNA